MAQISNSVLGNLSGKLGNLSARTLNGNTILASRPGPRNKPATDVQSQVHGKFKTTIELAQKIVANADLKFIWNKTSPAGSSGFNYAVKLNYPFSLPEHPTANNILTPGGFDLVAEDIPSTISTELGMTVNPIAATKVMDQEEVNVSFYGMAILYNPTDPTNKSFRLISKKLDANNFDFFANFEVHMPLDTAEQNIVTQYQNHISLFVAVTKSSEGKIIEWSETVH